MFQVTPQSLGSPPRKFEMRSNQSLEIRVAYFWTGCTARGSQRGVEISALKQIEPP